MLFRSMKSSYLPPSFASLVPSVWHQALQTLGLESENALACLMVDLDGQLRFAQQLLIVTDRRLLALQKGVGGVVQHQSWPLEPGLSLQHADHAGVGSLELLNATQRLAVWRFTLRHNMQALFLQDLLNQRCSGHTQSTVPLSEAVTEEEHQGVQSWGLLRLWRFAKPYQNQLFLGLGLT